MVGTGRIGDGECVKGREGRDGRRRGGKSKATSLILHHGRLALRVFVAASSSSAYAHTPTLLLTHAVTPPTTVHFNIANRIGGAAQGVLRPASRQCECATSRLQSALYPPRRAQPSVVLLTCRLPCCLKVSCPIDRARVFWCAGCCGVLDC